MDVGKRLKELRDSTGYSQNKLAEWAGISQSHYRRVELGQADITVGRLQLICDALGITLNEFFNTENDDEDISTVLSTLSPKQRKLLVEFLKSLNRL
jgi:transcriptional regulator with XRE-family HTH domain